MNLNLIFLPEATWIIAAALALVLLGFFIKYQREIFSGSADKFFVILRWSTIGFAAFLVLQAGFWSVSQYLLWQNVNPALLPPHQPITYFISYAWMQFAKENIFAIIFASMLLLIMLAMNHFSGNRFFYREEPWLAGFGAVAASWPAGFLVMIMTLIVGMFLQTALMIAGKREKMSLLWFWLPAALIAIIFGDIIGKWVGLDGLRVR